MSVIYSKMDAGSSIMTEKWLSLKILQNHWATFISIGEYNHYHFDHKTMVGIYIAFNKHDYVKYSTLPLQTAIVASPSSASRELEWAWLHKPKGRDGESLS